MSQLMGDAESLESFEPESRCIGDSEFVSVPNQHARYAFLTRIHGPDQNVVILGDLYGVDRQFTDPPFGKELLSVAYPWGKPSSRAMPNPLLVFTLLLSALCKGVDKISRHILVLL